MVWGCRAGGQAIGEMVGQADAGWAVGQVGRAGLVVAFLRSPFFGSTFWGSAFCRCHFLRTGRESRVERSAVHEYCTKVYTFRCFLFMWGVG